MLKLMIGVKGTGKTKTLIEKVHAAAEASKGDVVCIEKGTNLRFNVKNRVRLIDTEEYLIQDADYTLFGLANAVTRYSQDVESYDRATKLEEIGYSVMTMSPELFRRINQVTSMAA